MARAIEQPRPALGERRVSTDSAGSAAISASTSSAAVTTSAPRRRAVDDPPGRDRGVVDDVDELVVETPIGVAVPAARACFQRPSTSRSQNARWAEQRADRPRRRRSRGRARPRRGATRGRRGAGATTRCARVGPRSGSVIRSGFAQLAGRDDPAVGVERRLPRGAPGARRPGPGRGRGSSTGRAAPTRRA